MNLWITYCIGNRRMVAYHEDSFGQYQFEDSFGQYQFKERMQL